MTPQSAISGPHVLLEVEEALGPGIDFVTTGRGRTLVARSARYGGSGWLGFDRAVLVDSDDGNGRLAPVLVAVPVSTFVGCRVDGELVGGLRAKDGAIVLLARLPGGQVPALPIARVVARIPDGEELDAAAARHAASAARATYRARRAEERIVGGRAWLPSGTHLSSDRYSTPHSLAEYSLSRVPPRFVRGLEGLLDPGERILCWVERPPQQESFVQRLTHRSDRRAALLLLSDRQVLWLIDHMQPDRSLLDWGVDVDIVPVETIQRATLTVLGDRVVMDIASTNGATRYEFPSELSAELDVARRIAASFVADASNPLPRRVYEIQAVPFELDHAERFKQRDEAEKLLGEAGDCLGFVFSPARPGQRKSAGLAVAASSVELLGPTRRHIAVSTIHAIHIVLSPLIGTVRVIGREQTLQIVFPAPFSAHAASIVRVLRKLIANSAPPTT